MTANATVRTPADLTVIATCPTCEQPTAIRMQIGAELLVSDDGSELRLKGRSKGVAHICDQLPLLGLDHDDSFGHQVVEGIMDAVEDGDDITAPLRELAGRMGTDITVEAHGRTATIHGRKVDIDTGEILAGVDRPSERVPCPVEACTYSAEPGASIAGHVAMAHPLVQA